jgi:membrane fusion protein, macrolide-specific efflux system
VLARLLKKRRLVLSVAVIVVVAAGVAIWFGTRPTTAAPSYRLVPASVTTLRQTVSSSGTIQPAQRSDLNFGVSGQVTSVAATVGQQVTAGQQLATVQSASLSASLAQAQSTLASAQSKLSSDQSGSASSAQISADQAAITAAQNQVNNAQNGLDEATMTSPIAGTVAQVNLTVGQQVSAGGSTASTQSGGTNSQSGNGNGGSGAGAGQSSGSAQSSSSSSSSAQIVVISTNAYVVNASVDDTEVGQVRTGEQAVITPNGSATPVYGTVTSVAVMASGSSSVPSYPVTISVTGNPPGLIAGAGATVSIVVKQLTDVLAVPSAAVHYSGGKTTVEVMSGQQRVSKPVTTGMTSGGMTEIVEGLSEEDQVVVAAPAGGGTGTRPSGGNGPGGGTGRTGGGIGGGGIGRPGGGLGGFGG